MKVIFRSPCNPKWAPHGSWPFGLCRVKQRTYLANNYIFDYAKTERGMSGNNHHVVLGINNSVRNVKYKRI